MALRASSGGGGARTRSPPPPPLVSGTASGQVRQRNCHGLLYHSQTSVVGIAKRQENVTA